MDASSTAKPPTGLRTFIILWTGQMISLMGSGLTGFAFGVWAYQTTGSTTAFALMTFFAAVPTIFATPIAGVLVDHWDRRSVLILSDLAAASTTLAALLLAWQDNLQIWHLYLLVAIGATFNALQSPAFEAITPLLVPKRHLGRAAGLTQAAAAVPRVAAPLAAGALLAVIHLEGILILDLVAAGLAVFCLLLVRFPRPPETEEGKAAKAAPFRKQLTIGWEFIRPRRGLLALLILFACSNFISGMMFVLITPLVLSFADAKVLGAVISTSGVGFLLGGLVMTVWGGPKKRVLGILSIQLIQGVLLIVGALREDPWLISIVAFCFMFTMPILVGCAQAIWQVKVPPDLMGRVFSVRAMVAWSMLPLAYLLAGPLADHVFEPLLAPGGGLAASVGSLIGVGPGRGIAFQLMILGLLLLLVVTVAFTRSRLRNVETDLPDYMDDEPPGDEPSKPPVPGAATAEPQPNPGAP